MRYSAIVMEHFDHPRNCGEMKNPSVVGESVNTACLDRLRLFLRIEDGVIVDASFQSEGCVPSIAAGSVATEYLRGKRMQELRTITSAELERAMGGLPATKKHAAILAVEAIRDAVAKLAQRQ